MKLRTFHGGPLADIATGVGFHSRPTDGRSRVSTTVWSLIEIETRNKNERVARHERKPMIPDFNVLGQSVTSKVR